MPTATQPPAATTTHPQLRTKQLRLALTRELRSRQHSRAPVGEDHFSIVRRLSTGPEGGRNSFARGWEGGGRPQTPSRDVPRFVNPAVRLMIACSRGACVPAANPRSAAIAGWSTGRGGEGLTPSLAAGPALVLVGLARSGVRVARASAKGCANSLCAARARYSALMILAGPALPGSSAVDQRDVRLSRRLRRFA